ncbi:somatostatin receptor type 2-like, partial [Olea europaea subsp. europaea]
MYSFAIGFAFPLLLIAGFYLCVIRKLRNAASGQANLGSTRMKSRQSANKRIEYLVTGIICTYTICWLPYWITQLVVSFLTTFRKEPIEGFWQFTIIATSLSYTNSALNPILYAFLSDQFKRRCIEVFGTFLRTTGWYNLRSPTANPNITLATGAMCEPSEVKIRYGSGGEHNKGRVETNNESNTATATTTTTNNNNTSNTNHSRPESRQTMAMNDSVSLVISPNRRADILTTPNPARLDGYSDDENDDCNNGRVGNRRVSVDGRAMSFVNDDAQDQEDTRRRVIGGCPEMTRAQNSLSADNHYATTDGRGATNAMTSWSTTSWDKQQLCSSDHGQHLANNSAHGLGQPVGSRAQNEFDWTGERLPPG